MFLNLVLEFIPETVYKVARHYSKSKQTIPISFIKLYMYQLFRSLAYIHSLGICHRRGTHPAAEHHTAHAGGGPGAHAARTNEVMQAAGLRGA